MFPSFVTSTPPRIPPTFNASVMTTEVMQQYSKVYFGSGVDQIMGNTTLVAGVKVVLNANVSVGDFVFVNLVSVGGSGAVGVQYSVVVSDGSFLITSVDASRSTVATDISTLRYVIFKHT